MKQEKESERSKIEKEVEVVLPNKTNKKQADEGKQVNTWNIPVFQFTRSVLCLMIQIFVECNILFHNAKNVWRRLKSSFILCLFSALKEPKEFNESWQNVNKKKRNSQVFELICWSSWFCGKEIKTLICLLFNYLKNNKKI